uniref:Uncharacterized protein n=1 Tax=Arundo donax TaxID=35708 RepID=A0A0A9H6D3_ARUDO
MPILMEDDNIGQQNQYVSVISCIKVRGKKIWEDFQILEYEVILFSSRENHKVGQ